MKKMLVFIFLAGCSFSLDAQAVDYTAEITQHREAYKEEFTKDPRAPLSEEDLEDLRFFEPDENYRVPCRFELTPDEEPFDLPTYSGITKPFRKYGLLTFEWEGKTYQLAVYQNLKTIRIPMYREHLFLPFRDLTNGEATYGGGRYIDITIPELQKPEVFLDFNKCYNPWCAYSDGYNCPIPPAENHLELEIRAGEKMFNNKN